jgi:hypothetical protein
METTKTIKEVKYKNFPLNFESQLETAMIFAERLLQFVSRGIPDFPSHGVDHSVKIIEYIDSLIEKWPLILSEEEIYLLYLGAWLHDIGNIIERTNHNITSATIINESPIIESQLGGDTRELLAWIAKAHSSSFDIMDVPTGTQEIRLRFISSIFRILDACEITNIKCPTEVYKIIEKELEHDSKMYWEAHKSIRSVKFSNPIISITVDDLEKSEFLIEKLCREIDSVKDVILSNDMTLPIVEMIEMSPYLDEPVKIIRYPRT